MVNGQALGSQCNRIFTVHDVADALSAPGWLWIAQGDQMSGANRGIRSNLRRAEVASSCGFRSCLHRLRRKLPSAFGDRCDTVSG